ncbi:cysteine desulfurase family protein [Hymenobacter sp. BT770]|uniref:cysteine desulfurase family protein n=1 Tax=Hymenobacter sp. BT770 TaxID=2886942 RepID=UPI001D125DFA|nr:cysteine desulfurase family protein [Hymenobacter sp. BT770]MCC3155015.1 cysteine desulfurase [Hymenobacter sp. BT770]MDO3416967.1 cysteine desulfurase family protein [Hymenobacter sp. BT770]
MSSNPSSAPAFVYFDNAATTPLDPEVLEAMLPFLSQHYGNPSSLHGPGRQVRAAIENARKTVAHLLNAAPAEISFTSGGTEADNYAAFGSIRTLGLKHAITSPLEHHAVLHPLQSMAKTGEIELHYVRHDAQGRLDLGHLEELLATQSRTFVSLMHANNEIGNLNDIEAIGDICARHQAVFHTDTVQTMGHYRHDVQKLKNQFLVGSAHKFHGPKGVGFLYTRSGLQVSPLIHGGSQERNVRSGTENVYGIVGLAKALEIAIRDLAAHQAHVQGLKDRFIEKLRAEIDDVQFNGLSAQADQSLYTVLSVSLPPSPINEMLLFNLDISKIAASGGSACTSGAQAGSHVLEALGCDPDRATVRFSMSKMNTAAEVDYAVAQLAKLYRPVAA